MLRAPIVPLASLPNLGPRSQAMLEHAGITTLARLKALGAVRAYMHVKQCNARASLNLLWALHGALTDRPWQQVARDDRLALLMQLDSLARAAPPPAVAPRRAAGPAPRPRAHSARRSA